MRYVFTAIIVVLILGIAAFLFALSGTYNIARNAATLGDLIIIFQHVER